MKHRVTEDTEQIYFDRNNIMGTPAKRWGIIFMGYRLAEYPGSNPDCQHRFNQLHAKGAFVTKTRYIQSIKSHTYTEESLVFHKIFIVAFFMLTSFVNAGEERVFEGPWKNRRTGSSGTMSCTASEVSPGQWKGVFRGVFQGQKFEYQVDFRSTASSAGSELSGATTIDGQQYQWKGTLQASQLRGQYQASNGWNGDFVLNETAASRRKVPMSVEPESIEEVEIKPVVNDGDHLLFIGNGFMENDGGVYNYLEAALRKRGSKITHESKIAAGKSLSDMVTREIGEAMMSSKVNVIVITSGDPKVMKQFATKLKDSGKRLVVFMTWEERHPGNRATLPQYTTATKKAVRTMRELEKETGATIIPAAVLYHDLTVRPPEGMTRVDYLWRKGDSNQNAIGTMANALLMIAMLTGKSPEGLNFDFPPYIVGQKLQDEPELRLTRELRETLQDRAWEVAQKWVKGKTHLE